MAPVDLIINLLNTHIESETPGNYPNGTEQKAWAQGRKEALEDFRNELLNLKKLFN